MPLDELAVRLSAKVANRQPGIEGAKASFGAQYHSKIILEDAALHKRIEVCLICLNLPRMHAASVVLGQALPLSALPASIMYYDVLAHWCSMQEFKPDLMLADFVLAGGIALADKLGIPKAVMVPFFGSGMMNNLFGSGASLLATVPQFSSALPRHMVSNHVHFQRLRQEDILSLDKETCLSVIHVLSMIQSVTTAMHSVALYALLSCIPVAKNMLWDQAIRHTAVSSQNAFNVYVMTSMSLLSMQNLLQRLQNLAVYVMNDIGFTFVLEAHLNKVIWWASST